MAAITSQTFHASPLLSLPRSVRAAARVAVAGARLLAHVLRATPVDRATRTRAEEAEAVRHLAWRHQKTDPGFAADLMAAAARHEGMTER